MAENIRKKIAIIGLGRVGSSLARLLVENGIEFIGGFSSTVESSVKAIKKIQAGRVLSIEELKDADAVFVCVQDRNIEKIAKKISFQDFAFENMTFIHCSGSYGLDVLSPISEKGGEIAVFHPLFPFIDFEFSLANIRGAYVGVEGPEWLYSLAKRLGLVPFSLPKNRGKYHLGAVLSSGLLLSLLSYPEEIAKELGIPVEAYLKLAENAIKGAMNFSIMDSITGPWKRGDDEVIKKHLKNCSDPILYSRLLRRIREVLRENKH
ncbi:MAG: DUF2520 domain-containing protein [Candidatus Aminicenantes bacterium]|nr:DUF2520 domain-containing protein [Candidatus Aminicenantes bacterium]